MSEPATIEPKQAEMAFLEAEPVVAFVDATAEPADATAEPAVELSDVAVLVERLRGKGWMSADALLDLMGEARTEGRRRWLRKLANKSAGEIASGQEGYKRVREMTAEEYNHFRNAMKSQADAMLLRVLLSDKVFYGRQPVAPGNGIL